MAFVLGIFTNIQDYLGKEEDKLNPEMQENRGLSKEETQQIVATLDSMEQEMKFIRSLLQHGKRKKKKNPKLRSWVTNNMLLFTVVWQLILLLSVGFCEFFLSDSEVVIDIAISIGFFIQTTQMLFIIITSIKLVKQLSHRTASGWFLIQSYLSVIILFAGIYTLIFQIEPSCFQSDQLNQIDDETTEIFTIYTIFLYFSGVTMSTVGFGDIYPSQWYTQIIVFIQVMLSVVFTTVIFVKGLSEFGGRTQARRNSEEEEEEESELSVLSAYGSTE